MSSQTQELVKSLEADTIKREVLLDNALAALTKLAEWDKLQADNARLKRAFIAANNIITGKQAGIEERDRQIESLKARADSQAKAAETVRLVTENCLCLVPQRDGGWDAHSLTSGTMGAIAKTLQEAVRRYCELNKITSSPSSQSAAAERPNYVQRILDEGAPDAGEHVCMCGHKRINHLQPSDWDPDRCKLCPCGRFQRAKQEPFDIPGVSTSEGDSKRPPHLTDKVFTSTGAEYDPKSPGNVTVGVTAHCRCGNTFVDDIRACAPKAPPSPVDGSEQPKKPHVIRTERLTAIDDDDLKALVRTQLESNIELAALRSQLAEAKAAWADDVRDLVAACEHAMTLGDGGEMYPPIFDQLKAAVARERASFLSKASGA